MWLASLLLIALHTVDGRVIYVNALDVVSFVAVDDPGEKQYEGSCLMHLSDGKARSVAETCDVVQEKLLAVGG
jgi:hypothetical protein